MAEMLGRKEHFPIQPQSIATFLLKGKRHSATLQSHFVELYSAFKNGIRGLMVLVGTPKCRNNFNDNVSFNEFLTSNKKIHKKCWSEDVCAC